MGDSEKMLWRKTPLIYSSRIADQKNLQPAESFKSRGISVFAQNVKEEKGSEAHLIIVSGGNAGLAAACSAKGLGLKCTVFLLKGAGQDMIGRLEEQGSNVIGFGKNYHEASQEAERVSARDPAYGEPVVWEGHSTVIEEIQTQMSSKPHAIFCSVGGVGILGGIMQGCTTAGWDDVPIIALETRGSACFYYSMACNKVWEAVLSLPEDAHQLEPYDEASSIKIARFQIHSKASSLGAASPMIEVIKTKSAALEDGRSEGESRKVVFIVCGGVRVSLQELEEYDEVVEAALKTDGQRDVVFCNGERWSSE